MKNRLASLSKLSETKLRKMLKHFACDISATQCSNLCGVSRITVNRYYMEIRKTISANLSLPKFTEGHAELDESYFGSRYFRGKRGRGAQGKSIVFGIANRGGKVFAGVVPKVNRSTLFPVIERLVPKTLTVHTDCFRAYDALSQKGYRHFRVNHSANEFCNIHSSTNSIESFWSYCKRRLAKFNGIRKDCFSLHLSECEWRYNMRRQGWKAVYNALIVLLLENPLFKAVRKLLAPITALSRISLCEAASEPLASQARAVHPITFFEKARLFIGSFVPPGFRRMLLQH